MNHYALIACASQKREIRTKARNLYISPLFRYALSYALEQSPTEIYILSAKHGLVEQNRIITPYEQTLNNMNIDDRKSWAKRVMHDLTKIANLEEDFFTILAGKKYREYLVPNLRNHKIPLEGLEIGQQLQYLKRQTELFPSSN